MTSKSFQDRHLHYQVLFEYALLEYELDQRGKEPPRLPLKNPAELLLQIKTLRRNLKTSQTNL